VRPNRNLRRSEEIAVETLLLPVARGTSLAPTGPLMPLIKMTLRLYRGERTLDPSVKEML
jgi:hypothetical protein